MLKFKILNALLYVSLHSLVVFFCLLVNIFINNCLCHVVSILSIYGVIYLYFFLICILFVLLAIGFFLYQHIDFLLFQYTYGIISYFIFILSIYIQLFSLSESFNFIFLFSFGKNINLDYISLQLFEFSSMDCLFSTTTVQITFFVNLFSFFYINDSSKRIKFFALLNLFSISMVLLLHSKNFILLFFFWEMIGISSFLLICFFYSRPVTIKSAFKAMSFNRISDVCLLTSICIYFVLTNSVTIDIYNFLIILSNSQGFNIGFMSVELSLVFVLFISIASFIKSAQLIFHFWLPDSMEAPVPASSLIHSATLVASGIFLFFKFSIIIFLNYYLVNFLIILTSLTFLFGSAVSSYSSDIKKILAYSTIANCGFIFFSFLLCDDITSLYYFIMHGWYKSISFIASGYIILNNSHKQDTRVIFNNYNIIMTQLAIAVVNVLLLSSWFYFYTSSLKHSIVQGFYVTCVSKILILVGMVYSYIYSIRILYILFKSKNSNIKVFKNVVNVFSDCSLYIFFYFLNIIFFKYGSLFILTYNIDLYNIIILFFLAYCIMIFLQLYKLIFMQTLLLIFFLIICL